MSKVIFWNVVYDGDFSEIIKKTVSLVKKKEITVYYVCNWEKLAEELKRNLEKIGISVKTKDFLGCERYVVDGDVVICDGEFHLSCFEGSFIWVNPMQNEVLERESKRTPGKVSYAMTKRYFGIIVSTKKGQFKMEIAKDIKKKLEDLGKKVYIFVGDEIKDLENFPFIEVWINTACPRLKDDFKDLLFLNYEELARFFYLSPL